MGATVGTHVFNAMRPLHHRDPGPALALLEDRRVTVELIADGVHVHPALVRQVIETAGPHRVALISDAMAAAGLPDGSFRLGALEVDVVGRVARLRGMSTIAGSTATMDQLFRTAVGPLPRPRTRSSADRSADDGDHPGPRARTGRGRQLAGRAERRPGGARSGPAGERRHGRRRVAGRSFGDDWSWVRPPPRMPGLTVADAGGRRRSRAAVRHPVHQADAERPRSRSQPRPPVPQLCALSTVGRRGTASIPHRRGPPRAPTPPRRAEPPAAPTHWRFTDSAT